MHKWQLFAKKEGAKSKKTIFLHFLQMRPLKLLKSAKNNQEIIK